MLCDALVRLYYYIIGLFMSSDGFIVVDISEFDGGYSQLDIDIDYPSESTSTTDFAEHCPFTTACPSFASGDDSVLIDVRQHPSRCTRRHSL